MSLPRPRVIARLSLAAILLLSTAPLLSAADICVTVDETRDMFSPQDRTAALLILSRQFEVEGDRVVAAGCPNAYVVSHVLLGSTITITLSGPRGQRDATALGMDDVPSVYSQMVRSLIRGVPMTAPGVVDRTNVSNTQAEPAKRVYSDSLFYARLGYGAMFGDTTYGGPSVGFFGYRRELDKFGIDVSFFNWQYKPSSGGYYGSSDSGNIGTWLKLAFLRFTNPKASKSPYLGGGLSWSGANFDHGSTHWDGSGLQGELMAGYELQRASTIRTFLQVDVGLPFYTLHGESYTYTNAPPYMTMTTDHQYSPTVTVSFGLGWQRGGE